MDALQRIRELLDQYDWSVYKLSVKSGLPQSTLANMFARNNLPTIPTLEMICRGFGISMAEFFDYTEDDKLSSEQKTLLTKYNKLNREQKKLITDIIDNMK
ncbi:MAG: helix-turn-helix transcriptional regulator [Clostridia bacterium]|nr:helix-turn-helix transcriptional regulator [Clostridia bacterium]